MSGDFYAAERREKKAKQKREKGALLTLINLVSVSVTGCGCRNERPRKDLMKGVLISINTRNPLKITLNRDKDKGRTEDL